MKTLLAGFTITLLSIVGSASGANTQHNNKLNAAYPPPECEPNCPWVRVHAAPAARVDKGAPLVADDMQILCTGSPDCCAEPLPEPAPKPCPAGSGRRDGAAAVAATQRAYFPPPECGEACPWVARNDAGALALPPPYADGAELAAPAVRSRAVRLALGGVARFA